MKIIHSVRTKAAEADREIEGVAGAIFHEADEYNRYPLWEIVPASEVDRLYSEDHTDLITATHEEDIERELARKHPCEYPGGTHLWRVASHTWCTGSAYPHRWARRPERQLEYRDGWVVLNRVVLTNPATFEEIIDATNRLGPVLVPEHRLNRIAKDYYAAHQRELQAASVSTHTALCEHLGFVTRERAIDNLVQINHNPKAIERRHYEKKRRQVQKRLQGHFPHEVIHDLGHYVNINQWRDNPYRDVFNMSGPPSTETSGRGWGNARKHEKVDFGIDFIFQTIEFVRKLGCKQALGYWRNGSEYRYSHGVYESHTFAAAVERALQYLHGVEDHAREQMNQCRQFARQMYQEALARFVDEAELDGGVTHPEDWFTDEATWIKSYLDTHYDARRHQSHLRFCRWLRQEARACGVKLPPKPQLPTSPARRRRRKT